ncbi:high affinity cationic amino acid transporter 1 isoform X1 [Belonocnema kinseyi]|uniref:high affinity cationic amino acid transporter 1 isoform X1 n=1 Tax=Belonocnema kinseyi TaxID=2817044 RepID=UPI00143D96D9|nr:high affinity cationic amino acid transporter 1 isoform X1 [Belonocnema kinseyi]XP_033225256.1 high affinity cationic amino acid transporter 1 isoform X1 [Belonocnema kinseyi]
MALSLWKALSRRRTEDLDEKKGELARVLGLFDLTALGVGSTLGLGVYVLAGAVAKENAGPAVCLSFLVAAIASTLSGICYAEFAARVPKAGSAYVYSYVTVGEFIAFVIGWNLILEYVIGTASVARGLSSYLDALTGNAMGNALRSSMPINISFLSEYPDFFAFTVVMLLIVLLSIGAKESSILNNIFTTVNMITILVIIVAGSIKADISNWLIDVKDIPPDVKHGGNGGFMPFGISGVMVGAAKCFYGFVGFDGVATTGEEAKNPQRNIPLAIILSLSIIFTAYFSISTVLTMMWPYYDQDVNAPFPYAFEQIGWITIKWIVNIGAVFALFTSLLGAMFPLPRVLYAMGSDGVIFKFLAKIHSKTMTPVIGTIVSGLLTGLMTLIFNLHQLIDMMSIGTLLAYTIVSISVLILRYQKDEYSIKVRSDFTSDDIQTPLQFFGKIFNFQNKKEPSTFSGGVAKWGILLYSIIVFIAGTIFNQKSVEIINGNFILSVILAVLVLILILTVAAIGRQPVQQVELSFKVPLVPFIPCLSVLINLYLMLQLDVNTWIRFVAWMFIGLCIYFFYGITHSTQSQKDKVESDRLSQKYTEKLREVTKC